MEPFYWLAIWVHKNATSKNWLMRVKAHFVVDLLSRHLFALIHSNLY